MSSAAQTAMKAGLKTLDAAAGVVNVGASAFKTSVNLAGTAVNVAGKAGGAALTTAGDAAAAAAAVTSAASKAASDVAGKSLNAAAKISGQALNATTKISGQALNTGATTAVETLKVTGQLTKNVLGSIGKTGKLVTQIVNSPLDGFSAYLEKRDLRADQLKDVKSRTVLINSLVDYYVQEQKSTLKDIKNLVQQRLALAGEIRLLFRQSHCTLGYLYNTCDTTFDATEQKFKELKRHIQTKLLIIESTLVSLTAPLKTELVAAMSGKETIEKDELNSIFKQKTAPHSARIEKFYTLANRLCDNATELFASKDEDVVPPFPVLDNYAPSLSESTPPAEGGRRRTKRRSVRFSRRKSRPSLGFGRRKRLTSRRGSKRQGSRTRRA
jgi:hypothetical protein